MCGFNHERRGSFGIDSPETSYEPFHSESLTYHLILRPQVGMHGSTWEVKMHIEIYWMHLSICFNTPSCLKCRSERSKIIKEYSSPSLQPPNTEHRATINIVCQSYEMKRITNHSLKERLELLQQHMDYMLHHILLPFTACRSRYWQRCSRFRVHCWENDCTKRAWEINFTVQADKLTPSHK